MFFPQKTKYKKMHLRNLRGIAFKNNKKIYGIYAIQALESKYLKSNQLEAVRKILSRHTKKFGNIWIKVFPDNSITQKPNESRMGSGKGSVKYWVIPILKNTILFEYSGLTKDFAKNLWKNISSKLPLKTKFLI